MTTRISSRDLANQFIKNPKLTKSKRFYVNNLLGKRICRVLDLINVNGEQRLLLVYYFIDGVEDKISNPKLHINDNLIFEEIENIDNFDDVEINDPDNDVKKFGGTKKSIKVKKRSNKKRSNKKRSNKKRSNKKRSNNVRF
jgi:hypothetical protein